MDLLLDAVANNVAWCSVVCAGGSTAADSGIWRMTGDPVPLFPDAVTTRPGVSAADVVEAVADRPVCSVKDSFADVDLAPHGFRALFTGSWIGIEAPTSGLEPGWSRVVDEAGLERWCASAELPGTLPARLLEDPAVHVLSGPGRGAITNLSGAVVGVSNVVGDDVWPQLAAVVAGHVSGQAIVGYEHGEDLEAALAARFSALGPIRVWLRP